MTIIETVDQPPVAAKLSPRYLQRRAGDDKAASAHRRAVGSFDPLAATAGVSSCHYRRRVSDDRAAAASVVAAALAALPPPVVVIIPETLQCFDRGTPELRRRILQAAGSEVPAGLHRNMARSLAAGMAGLRSIWHGRPGPDTVGAALAPLAAP